MRGFDVSMRPKRLNAKYQTVIPKRKNYYGDGYIFVEDECEEALVTEEEEILTDELENCLITE